MSRNDLIYDNLDGDGEEVRFGNRISIGASETGLVDFYSVQLEHVDDSFRDRTQLYASRGKTFAGNGGSVDAYVLLQHDETDAYGLLTETTVEKRLRGNYWYVAGLGAAYLNDIEDRAEGILTIGISRRNLASGWFGRVDFVTPFDVGLPRANRVTRTFRVQVGTRYDWRDISELRRLAAPVFFRNDYGRVEGRVTADGEPVANATVMINGRPMASTGSDGRFSVARVAVGQISLSLDPFSIDPSFAMNEDPIKVNVAPRQTASVEIRLTKAVALFGSLVRCEGEALRAVPGASVALIGEEGVYTFETTVDGGFALTDVAPGHYDIVVDPATVGDVPPDRIPALSIDLTEDRLGYVIRIGCP